MTECSRLIDNPKGSDVHQSASLDLLRNLIPPQYSKTDAYNMGYDCGVNGPTDENCHFAIFCSLEHVRAWETGKQDAEQVGPKRTHRPK
ncbi:hypothetical protein ACW73L_19580 [Methylolobus aquaticus]